MPRSSSIKVAILPQGGERWIAGIIYNHNLIRALYSLPKEERPDLHFFVGPADDLYYHDELASLRPKIHYYCYRDKTAPKDKLYDIKYSLMRFRWPSSLERLVRKLKPTVVFPAQGSLGAHFPCPWIGWIPDFQHKHFPLFFSDKENQERDKAYERLIKESRHIVVSSQDSYNDLMRFFPVAKGKASVLPFYSVASEQWYQGDPHQVATQFKLPKKFLIFPSQFWVHKNHRTVFEALAILKKQGLKDICLVCTGLMNDYRSPEHFGTLKTFIEDNDLVNNIHFLGLLPRNVQIQLIRASGAVIQPSLFEGWSSLVEDARTLGKDIFLSDIPIHREQDPPRAFFFPPENPKKLAELIASQWASLTEGVDLKKEQQAYRHHLVNAQAFARNFLSIVEKTHR